MEVDGQSPASFDDMYANAFAVKYNVSGSVMCNSKTFGFDPQPGKVKQCYCDDIEYEGQEEIESELEYWSEYREVETIKEQSESEATEEESSFMSAEKIQEQTQAKIAEEEEKHAKETED